MYTLVYLLNDHVLQGRYSFAHPYHITNDLNFFRKFVQEGKDSHPYAPESFPRLLQTTEHTLVILNTYVTQVFCVKAHSYGRNYIAYATSAYGTE